ncbi:MAG: EamA family transporter [Syntrophomonadaceae bacterium]|jgi:transporter family protein|nr:EamA family transporter [Syntrophomonadaceae bacterium]
MWVLYAVLSAVFAALTSIFAKIGIDGVNSNLATAIRTIVVIVMAWGIVFLTGAQNEISDITRKSWIFLTLSGCATGFSWLFFYKALQMGEVSKIVPIDKSSIIISMILAFLILGEPVDTPKIIGGALIVAGTFVLIL